jgi:hypothetical protein
MPGGIEPVLTIHFPTTAPAAAAGRRGDKSVGKSQRTPLNIGPAIRASMYMAITIAGALSQRRRVARREAERRPRLRCTQVTTTTRHRNASIIDMPKKIPPTERRCSPGARTAPSSRPSTRSRTASKIASTVEARHRAAHAKVPFNSSMIAPKTIGAAASATSEATSQSTGDARARQTSGCGT